MNRALPFFARPIVSYACASEGVVALSTSVLQIRWLSSTSCCQPGPSTFVGFCARARLAGMRSKLSLPTASSEALRAHWPCGSILGIRSSECKHQRSMPHRFMGTYAPPGDRPSRGVHVRARRRPRHRFVGRLDRLHKRHMGTPSCVRLSTRGREAKGVWSSRLCRAIVRGILWSAKTFAFAKTASSRSQPLCMVANCHIVLCVCVCMPKSGSFRQGCMITRISMRSVCAPHTHTAKHMCIARRAQRYLGII